MTSNRVNEIDLLRFLSALAVVFFHYAFRGYAADGMSLMPYPMVAPAAKYGYLGVALFFMISGFVILMTAAEGSLRNFIISRIARLYPAFWVCCTLTFAVTVALGAPRFTASLHQYLVNMTMLSGFLGVPEIDGSYWSLFVEIKFYALVAVILLVKKIHRAQGLLIGWLICAVALQVVPVKLLNFFLIVEDAPLFIAGATFFLIWRDGVSFTRMGVVAVSWILAMYNYLKVLPVFESHYRTTINHYVVGAIITAFFIVMLLVSLRRTHVIGNRRWLLAGALAYPLYLLHQVVGFIIFNIAYPAINQHVLFWGVVGMMLCLAYAISFFIEQRSSRAIKQALNFMLAPRARPVVPVGRE